MKFTTRTKAAVLADLTEKLRSLPLQHPDRDIVARIISELSSELKPKLPIRKT
jgi:hypothetical protein